MDLLETIIPETLESDLIPLEQFDDQIDGLYDDSADEEEMDMVLSRSASARSASSRAGCSYKCKSNKAIGEVNGVKAYSNGEFSGTGNACGLNYVSGYCTGYKWQCVEFVNRYFLVRFGKRIAGGNAGTYYGNAAKKGLNRASNGGRDKPQAGNLLCFSGGFYGHVGIVKKVGDDYVTIVHQNWNCKQGEMKLKMQVTKKNGKKYYTVANAGGYKVQGWLWPKK